MLDTAALKQLAARQRVALRRSRAPNAPLRVRAAWLGCLRRGRMCSLRVRSFRWRARPQTIPHRKLRLALAPVLPSCEVSSMSGGQQAARGSARTRGYRSSNVRATRASLIRVRTQERQNGSEGETARRAIDIFACHTCPCVCVCTTPLSLYADARVATLVYKATAATFVSDEAKQAMLSARRPQRLPSACPHRAGTCTTLFALLLGSAPCARGRRALRHPSLACMLTCRHCAQWIGRLNAAATIAHACPVSASCRWASHPPTIPSLIAPLMRDSRDAIGIQFACTRPPPHPPRTHPFAFLSPCPRPFGATTFGADTTVTDVFAQCLCVHM